MTLQPDPNAPSMTMTFLHLLTLLHACMHDGWNGKGDSPLIINHQLSSQVNVISNIFIIHQADAPASMGMLRCNTSQVITMHWVYMYINAAPSAHTELLLLRSIWSINDDWIVRWQQKNQLGQLIYNQPIYLMAAGTVPSSSTWFDLHTPTHSSECTCDTHCVSSSGHHHLITIDLTLTQNMIGAYTPYYFPPINMYIYCYFPPIQSRTNRLLQYWLIDLIDLVIIDLILSVVPASYTWSTTPTCMDGLHACMHTHSLTILEIRGEAAGCVPCALDGLPAQPVSCVSQPHQLIGIDVDMHWVELHTGSTGSTQIRTAHHTYDHHCSHHIIIYSMSRIHKYKLADR
jgi:hypothetical protein